MTHRTAILRCLFCLIIAAGRLAVPSHSSDLPQDFNQDIPADPTLTKTAADWVKAGYEQRDAGNTEEAAAAYREAIRLDPQYEPSNPGTMNDLGYVLLELNEDLEEALDLARRAAEANPSSAAFRDTLGWAYFKNGKYPEAEKELVLASRMSPETADILEHLGDLYEKQGRTTDAVTAWTKALSLSGDEEMKARLKAKLNAR